MTIKILLLDRAGRIQDALKQTLSPLECQVIPASSTALAVFLARKNFPSLIVLNLVSDDDEYDLPQEIANDAELTGIPVVVFVPPGNAALISKIPLLGHVRVIPTPDNAESLRSVLVPFLLEKTDHREKDTSE